MKQTAVDESLEMPRAYRSVEQRGLDWKEASAADEVHTLIFEAVISLRSTCMYVLSTPRSPLPEGSTIGLATVSTDELDVELTDDESSLFHVFNLTRKPYILHARDIAQRTDMWIWVSRVMRSCCCCV